MNGLCMACINTYGGKAWIGEAVNATVPPRSAQLYRSQLIPANGVATRRDNGMRDEVLVCNQGADEQCAFVPLAGMQDDCTCTPHRGYHTGYH